MKQLLLIFLLCLCCCHIRRKSLDLIFLDTSLHGLKEVKVTFEYNKGAYSNKYGVISIPLSSLKSDTLYINSIISYGRSVIRDTVFIINKKTKNSIRIILQDRKKNE